MEQGNQDGSKGHEQGFGVVSNRETKLLSGVSLEGVPYLCLGCSRFSELEAS